MKIYIPYEVYSIEFFAKLLFSLNIINKYKKIEEIKIGYSRIILQELLFKKEKKNEKIVIIYGNIWKQSEILIDLFLSKNFHFISLHEEEHILYFIKNKKNFFNNSIIQRSYFDKLTGYLTLSNKTKKFYLANNFSKKKMIIIGKLKLNFLKFICNKEKVNKNPKRVLLILNDAYFRNKKDFEKNKKKVIEYDFSNYAKDNFNSMEFDNGLLFVYTKKQIELYKKIAKNLKILISF